MKVLIMYCYIFSTLKTQMFHCNSHSASISFGGGFRLTLHKVDVSYVGVTQSESGENRFYPSTFVMK